MNDQKCMEFGERIIRVETRQDTHSERIDSVMLRMDSHITEDTKLRHELNGKFDSLMNEFRMIKYSVIGGTGVLALMSLLSSDSIVGQLLLKAIG